MIPKNELRIGNWITNEAGKFTRILNGNDIDKADAFSAIEINDDVLQRCGFVYHEYFKVWQKTEDKPKTGYLLEMDMDYNVRDFGRHYIGVKLHSLHQLQNLLYQLKGVELQLADKNLPAQEKKVKLINVQIEQPLSN